MKKLRDRKRKMQWRVWKREVLELELDRFILKFFVILLNKICVQHKDLYFWRSSLISIPPLRLGIPLPSDKSKKLIVES